MLEFYLLLVLILGSEMKRYLIVLMFLLYIGCEMKALVMLNYGVSVIQ